MQNFQKSRKIILAIFFILVSFTGGLFVGRSHFPEVDKVLGVNNKETQVTTSVDFAPFWKVWNTIDEKYPNASKVADQDRVYGAIAGLVKSLNDPYSVFFVPDEAKSFEDEIAGSFTGIGMEVGQKDKILTVIAPLKDTPAYKAGIKSGDKVLKIDQTNTYDLDIDKAIKLIRGEAGTIVSLIVLHEGDTSPIEIKITRAVIDIPTLDTEVRSDGIFVIKLYSFSANSADLFRSAVKKFAATGGDKLILDLRGNPGGYLSAAVDISSWFLPGGETVVSEDYGTGAKPEIFRSRGYDVFKDTNLKFAILIDKGSASASEIVAGAMQDHKIAKLVGSQSFGKGSVQETVKVTPDTLLKVTVAKWLTPNGTSISEKGLTPDYIVEYTKKNAADKTDPQLDKAVEILLK